MLPIKNKPIIQWLVDELRASGIDDIILVVNKQYGKIIKKYFSDYRGIKVIYQKGNRYGNAIPALQAKKYIKDRFIYLYGDDFVFSEIPATLQLLNSGFPSIMVSEVKEEEASNYGIVNLNTSFVGEEYLEEIEEKPKNPKTNLASLGRFYLPKEVLDEIRIGKNNEYWFADAVNRLSKRQFVNVKRLEGKWLTTGDPINYKKALDYVYSNEKWKTKK